LVCFIAARSVLVCLLLLNWFAILQVLVDNKVLTHLKLIIEAEHLSLPLLREVCEAILCLPLMNLITHRLVKCIYMSIIRTYSTIRTWYVETKVNVTLRLNFLIFLFLLFPFCPFHYIFVMNMAL
jgi:hypothetical protein